MEFTGRPQPDDVEAIDSPFAGTMMESCTVTHAKSLSALFPNISAEAADLLRCAVMCADFKQTNTHKHVEGIGMPVGLQALVPYLSLLCMHTLLSHSCCCLLLRAHCRKLLAFNPNKRLSPEEALRHPYVSQFHNAADEPVAGKVFVLPISDNTKYTVAEYRWVRKQQGFGSCSSFPTVSAGQRA